MNKVGSDPKVKKTLVRNCEKKVRLPQRKQVIYDVGASGFKDKLTKTSGSNENELDQPTLCSSEVLAHYISEVKVSAPPPLTSEVINVDKGQISSKVTKKLNFHFNDRIYMNLIELNANIEDLKKKRDKRPSSSHSIKKDVEPNIDDFYEELIDKDAPPSIPLMKPKFKTVKKVENGDLHRIVSTFENL